MPSARAAADSRACQRHRQRAAHHEFKGFRTHVPFECRTSPLKIVQGRIQVPTGTGWGVDLAPDFIREHAVVKA